MSFKCKGPDGRIYEVTWEYIKGAWVSAITVCDARLFKYNENFSHIPNLLDLAIVVNGTTVYMSWLPNVYTTYFQVKVGEGSWIDAGTATSGSSAGHIDWYCYATRLSALATFIGLPEVPNASNVSHPENKPTLTSNQIDALSIYYAADIALYNSIQK